MAGLNRFEQRLEHLVTGAFARVFRSAVQPMEIAAALQREIDKGAQILSRDRRIVPNDFTIDLAASDYDRLAAYGQALSSELAAMLHQYAQEQHYVFAGPLQLSFQRSTGLSTGRFRVSSAASAQVTPAAPAPAAPPYRQEVPPAPASLLLEIGHMRHPLTAPGLIVGRGSTAGLRIDDGGVSRRHVEFRVHGSPHGGAPGGVTVVDLGSTNGTTVNGKRVQHASLTEGDVVQIGSTRIMLRVAGTPARPLAPPPSQPYVDQHPRPSPPPGTHPTPPPYSSRTQSPNSPERW